MSISLYLSTNRKINSQWVADLNAKAKTIKYLDKDIRKKSFCYFSIGKDFLGQEKRESEKKKFYKLDFI